MTLSTDTFTATRIHEVVIADLLSDWACYNGLVENKAGNYTAYYELYDRAITVSYSLGDQLWNISIEVEEVGGDPHISLSLIAPFPVDMASEARLSTVEQVVRATLQAM